MAKNIMIGKLDIDTKNLVDAAEKTKKQIDDLLEKQGKLSAKGKESSEQFIANAAALKGLHAAYREQTTALSAQINEEGKLLSAKKAIKEAVNEVNRTENDYINNSRELLALKKNLNTTDDDYEKRLAKINGKLQENNNWLKENGSAHAKLITTMSDYKQQVTESFDSINIFNGGLSGLVSRAQEAGGAGPLLKGAFDGMSQGIMGMTRSSLAFIATPIGAVIAALGIVIGAVVSYFRDTQEGIDKVTAVTRPLQSVFNALMGTFQSVGKYIADAFTNPKQALMDFGATLKSHLINHIVGLFELIPNLGKSIGLLFEGKFAQAGKVAADAMGKVALGTENVTDKVAGAAQKTSAFLDEAYSRGKKIDQLQKSLDKGLADYTKRNSELTIELNKQNTVADDTNATFAQREAAAGKAITTAKEHNKLLLERMDTEIELLRLKQQENGITDAEKAELAAMVAKRKEAAAEYASGEKALTGKLSDIRQEATDKERDRQQKLAENTLQKRKQELDLFIQQQGEKTKSLDEEVKYNEEVKNKKLVIARAEYNASAKTAGDKRTMQLAEGAASIENAKANANATLTFANAEFSLWMEQHKSLLDGKRKLTDELIAEEARRLEDVKAKQLQNLALNKHTSEAEIQRKRDANLQLSIEDNAYLEEKHRIETEYNDNKNALDKTAADKKAADKLVELEVEAATATTKYDEDVANEQIRYDTEIAKLDERKAQGLITEQQYNALKEAEGKKHSGILQGFDDAVLEGKLNNAQMGLSAMAAILGKESAAGKAIAVAQATIDTYRSAVAAYAAGMAVGGPAGLVLGPVSAAAAVAAGIGNVKKITSTKTPKAEKGALFNIGGNRHSNGGTMFTGADGTRFEAEQGELIGVMNRNAAAHFMAFNNAFPAGGSSAPNYFANGGIVSREISSPQLNIDELAAKIALANSAIPAPVVAIQDIVTQGNSYVQVRDAANF